MAHIVQPRCQMSGRALRQSWLAIPRALSLETLNVVRHGSALVPAAFVVNSTR